MANFKPKLLIRGNVPPLVNRGTVGFGTRFGPADNARPGKIAISRFQTGGLPLNRLPSGSVVAGPGAEFTQQWIKKITLDLSVARSDILYNISGTIIWGYRVFTTSTGAPVTTAFYQIRIGDILADQLTWYAGNGIEGIPFNKIYISNGVQADTSLELAYFSDTSEKPVRFF